MFTRSSTFMISPLSSLFREVCFYCMPCTIQPVISAWSNICRNEINPPEAPKVLIPDWLPYQSNFHLSIGVSRGRIRLPAFFPIIFLVIFRTMEARVLTGSPTWWSWTNNSPMPQCALLECLTKGWIVRRLSRKLKSNQCNFYFPAICLKFWT